MKKFTKEKHSFHIPLRSFLTESSIYAYVLLLVVIALILSLVLYFTYGASASSLLLKYTLITGSLPFWYILSRDFIKGHFGVDIIAGIALFGTFAIGQYLAGVVVLFMLSGGQLFEIYAMKRARKELSSLLSRTPTYAHHKSGEVITDIPIKDVTIGMHVLVKPGEIIPVDGTIIEGDSTIDESSLTGESIPVRKSVGRNVFAGTENSTNVLVVLVETTPSESRYQSIIKLVQQAEKSKAPIVRLADHYSIYFTGVTFLIALLAWFISGDLARVVAVLVVATPCPLLLATPIAIVSGISKAALNGVIVKDGGALETLSRAEVFMFDKTGTLTLGTPQVTEVISYGSSSREEVLHIAASLDQLSTHILARSLKSEADSEHIKLSYPEKFQEHFGDGVSGTIATTRYTLGKKSLISKLIGGNVPNEVEDTYKAVSSNGSIVIFLANESKVLGAIVFQDTLRSDAAHLFKKLSREGIKKSVLLTGDKEERAKSIGETLHLKDVISECLPEDKLKYVKKYQKNKTVVVMVGDGINDAPALAKADVGIALGIHGQTASSDVADIVILSPSVSKTYDVLHIAKKTVYLAKEGIFIGIGASTVAMIFAAFGYIPPLEGTILQEAIDVAVILNALRLGSTLKNA